MRFFSLSTQCFHPPVPGVVLYTTDTDTEYMQYDGDTHSSIPTLYNLVISRQRPKLILESIHTPKYILNYSAQDSHKTNDYLDSIMQDSLYCC